MQTYIQENWTYSDPNATGGSHYENIKIYGHAYGDLLNDQTDADFIAKHFDVYMWGGPIVGTRSALLNSKMLWLGEAANIPAVRNSYPSPSSIPSWDSLQVNTFLANANPNNYTFDDLLLHFKVNTNSAVVSFTPGWNPTDDGDGNGCIDGSPSDPNRTAQCIWNARARDIGPAPAKWPMANVAGQPYIDFRAWYADDLWDNQHVEGFHFDEASYQSQGIQLGNTFEYYGQSETSPSFTYISDKYAFVPAVMSQVEEHTGEPTIAFANVVSSDYLCGSGSYLGPQHDLAYNNLENILLEEWMPNRASVDTTKVDQMLKCPFTDFLEHGKGVVFTYREDSAEGRLFSLCMFYMINHQMAFYYYTKQGHSGVNASTGQWNPWVEYNVGQPTANDLGKVDFWGNSGTDKFFVFARGTDNGVKYMVLGREYFRDSDEAIILVLAKVMGAPGQTEGTHATTVQLGDHYRLVQSDFLLSTSFTSIALKNNEGVILIRNNTGSGNGCHCSPQG